MKLITIGRITLNRPGSIERGGFQRTVGYDINLQRIFTVVLDGEQPEHVLAKVKDLAMANGESAQGVEKLAVATLHGARDGVILFNERFEVNRTQFGLPYAETEVFPALEVDGRYFRLNEVSCSG
jgi:hypothetical protein